MTDLHERSIRSVTLLLTQREAERLSALITGYLEEHADPELAGVALELFDRGVKMR